MISYLLPQRAATVQTLGHPAAGVIGWFDASQNTSGVAVTQSTALTLAAVWCATRVIAETIATLPCLLYRRKSDDSRERASDDNRYWLVSEQPHPAITAVSFFESLTAQLVLSGNCYAEISAGGTEWKLEPRASDNVRVTVAGDEVLYDIINPAYPVPMEDMLRVPGLGGDGITGWSVIRYAAQSLGGGLAADQYAGGQWGNGATPSGVLTHPMRLDKAARDAMRREWEDVHKGASNAGKIAIMHGGMDFKPVSMTNEDAQFLESRQFSVREVARWFRLPPHMLADLADSSVRANIEQQALEFIVYSLRPWMTRWEQTLNRKLLSRDERRTLYFEFLVESLLRGDSAAQATAWSVGRQWGWYSVNEIRRQMNMPPVEGGDVYLQPSNMVPSDSELAQGNKPAPPTISQPRQRDDEEEVPESLGRELRENLTSSIAVILDAGKQFREDLEAGRDLLADSLVAVDQAASAQMRGLHEIREEIHRDINRSGSREQVRGFDAVLAACDKLLHSHLHTVLKAEKNKVTKAVKAAVNCGDNFINWMADYYAGYSADIAARIADVEEAYSECAPPDRRVTAKVIGDVMSAGHTVDLLHAADGDREHFAERVRAAMDGWDEQIEKLSLGA